MQVSLVAGDEPLMASLGTYHSCAALFDGTVRCWGANVTGQLGDGTNLGKTTPVAVLGLTDVLHLGLGDYSSYALFDDLGQAVGDGETF